MAFLPAKTTPYWAPRQQPHARRAEANRHVYNSWKWKKDRSAYIKANPLCAECLKQGKTTAATVSDHITPINEGGDIWDWNNRQALCTTCHNKKSANESRN